MGSTDPTKQSNTPAERLALCIGDAPMAVRQVIAGDVRDVLAEREQLQYRVEELEADAERVSHEFEGECWKTLRTLLDETDFEWESEDDVTAHDAYDHLKETISYLENEGNRLTAERDEARAENERLKHNNKQQANMIYHLQDQNRVVRNQLADEAPRDDETNALVQRLRELAAIDIFPAVLNDSADALTILSARMEELEGERDEARAERDRLLAKRDERLRALSLLVELKDLKDREGTTSAYLARKDEVWAMARAALAPGDRND